MPETSEDPSRAPVRSPDLLDSDDAGRAAIRGAGARVTGYALAVLLSVGSSALLFRHLGVVSGGHYVLIVSLVTLAGGMTDAGLSMIGVRELSSGSDTDRRRFMRSLGGLRVALSACGIVLALVFAAVAGYPSVLVWGTLVAGVGLLLQVIQDTYAIVLTSELRLAWVAAADLLRQAVSVALIAGLVLAGASLLPFFAVAIPAGLASVALTAWLVRGRAPLLPSVDLGHWRRLLGQALVFSIATIVASVYFRVAILIVSLVASPRQNGYFAVPFRVVEVLVGVPVLLVGSSFPIFARAAQDDHTRLAYALGRTFDACLILGTGVALALVVGAPVVIAIVAGSHFHPSEAILRIQGLAMIASFTGAVWGYALLSLRRHRAVLVCTALSLAVTVVATYAFTAADGAEGAAIGTTIAEWVYSLVLGVAVFRGGVRPAVAWRALPRVAAAALVGAATLLVPGVPSVVRVLAAMVLYVVTLLGVRAVPPELLDHLPARLRALAR